MTSMAEANERISVIVPIYNVEIYLAKCLNSILEQTYSNLEVLCIDDGSQDASGTVCDEYARRDSRVKVYHVRNNGVSSARNYGLSLATGDWFCFVDADDWLDKEYISRLYSLAKDNDCDLAACDLLEIYGESFARKEDEEKLIFFESPQECVHNFICNENSMHGRCLNKLYRADKFKDIRFCEELKINEDCLYTYEVMIRCSRAVLTTKPYYFLLVRPDSACHKKPQAADFSAANVFLTLYEKTIASDDEQVLLTLKMNYVNAAVRVLFFAKYNKNNREVYEARHKCREWRKDVWKYLEFKDKLKYILAMYVIR